METKGKREYQLIRVPAGAAEKVLGANPQRLPEDC